jgi:hypothetical protein
VHKASRSPSACSFRLVTFKASPETDNMNNVNEKPTSAMEVETYHAESGYDEKSGLDRAGAIDAENIEHNMGVLESIKAYPAASWWAFVMSCTIVRFLP